MEGSVQGLKVVRTDEGLALSGEIDLANRAALSNALQILLDTAKGPTVVLDLAEVSFIDGQGVAEIARVAHGLGPSKLLVVRGAPVGVARVAGILGLDRVSGLVVEPIRHDGDG
jgi:anti-anti-sigma factor